MSDNKGFMAQPGLPSSFASPGGPGQAAGLVPRLQLGLSSPSGEGSWSEIMGALNSLRQKQLASATPVTQGRCAKCHGLFPIATFVGPDRLLEVNCEECRKANNDKVSTPLWWLDDGSEN
ncbi:hypothetical protein N7532_001491 [Penicillium argentinense]|uniref:Uncharacterized protein n=1 Tax=Penicillium argentinense TaxID=1131581 RepID=A0A9W9KMH5_9EURO|nr:uncharacterized protein N7532_001491 [Penicillium argentinense]KAJ5110956.1 hypothetical protein N7532_001491 [Penicillium argentinense]